MSSLRAARKRPARHRQVKAPSPTAVAFIALHLGDAQAVNAATGVPVGVILAQSAIESGWGQHVSGNAYFGVKGHAPDGQSTNFATHEVVGGQRIAISDSFRAYSSYRDAAMDYGNMLRSNPRFAGAFRHRDALNFVTGLNGYATDPRYIQHLQSVIRTYNLSRYDQP